MLVFVAHHCRHTLDTAVGHESKPTRLLSSFILENDAVLEDAKPTKVISELVQGQVVWQTPNEYLSVLRIVHVDGLLYLVNFILQFRVLRGSWRSL